MMRICTICARGGSKGVKGKNLRIIKGKPLIYYSIKQALDSHLFSLVVVSSDSEDILNAAKEAGAQLLVKRPLELATDESAKLPAIQHAFKKGEEFLGRQVDILVDLDCTSPLRNVEDIINSVKLLEASGAPNIITGSTARRSPYFNLVELNGNGTVQLAKKANGPIIRRQDVPKCFDMNASIYVWNRNGLLSYQSVLNDETRLYEMPEERSIDIDSELDFQIVEFLMNKRDDL